MLKIVEKRRKKNEFRINDHAKVKLNYQKKKKKHLFEDIFRGDEDR